jgi:hypothetical protein
MLVILKTKYIQRQLKSMIFLSVHIGFLGGFMWRLQEEPLISNSFRNKIHPTTIKINDIFLRVST